MRRPYTASHKFDLVLVLKVTMVIKMFTNESFEGDTVSSLNLKYFYYD